MIHDNGVIVLSDEMWYECHEWSDDDELEDASSDHERCRSNAQHTK